MKFLIALCALTLFAGTILASPIQSKNEKWIVLPDMQNHLHLVNLNAPVPRLTVDPEMITFYYFSRQTNSLTLKLSNIDDVFTSDYTPRRKTMFIIHGWTSNGQSHMNDLLTDALLKADDWNIFNIDWHEPASQNYIAAKGSLPAVSEIVADFIKHLNAKGLKLDHVYVTGHSLGGQMSGRVGAHLGGQIAYIVGLDPALPMFNYNNLADRLDPSDAKHVQVIHTNGGLLGYMLPLGHSDFYPNGGGKTQPGCENDSFGLCAHVRAYLFFAESINNGMFLSHSCDDFSKYKTGQCYGNHFAIMGGNYLDTSAQGSYYLETKSQAPFALA